jgi:D-alanyl-D-alanine carboxypeptidase/D-alanyl-D-alanine-endopeptidase (penicillin-binding protein 4)
VSHRAIAISTAALVWGLAMAFIVADAVRPEPRPELPTLELSQPLRIAAAPPVLASSDVGSGGSAASLADRLDDLVNDGDLGDQVGMSVARLGGEVIYEHEADETFTPASTLKIVTAAAALEALGPDARFATRVMTDGEPDEIILVGGGDPTLATGDLSSVPGGAGLAELAEATAEVLAGAAEVSSVRLWFDDSLFTGPAIDPDWEAGYVSNGIVAPVAALMVDDGRVRPGSSSRADDPAQAAAEHFAALLADRGLSVSGRPERIELGEDAESVAEVWSAPLGDIVEYMLASSNNDVSETLTRHVALATGDPGTAAAAAPAVVDVLSGIGVDITSQTVLDGSGLARGSAISPDALVQILNQAAQPDRTSLRPMLSGLPVASFNGTLRERVTDGAGAVRAKTGTLTGVASLAGTATDTEGVTYVFAVLADDVTDTLAAREAIDAVAAAIVR